MWRCLHSGICHPGVHSTSINDDRSVLQPLHIGVLWLVNPCKRIPRCVRTVQVLYKLRVPNPDRFVVLRQAFEEGITVDEMYEMTKMDKWWLEQMKEVYDITVRWRVGKRKGLGSYKCMVGCM